MAEPGLLVEIGLTERQYQQALARIEAQTLKSAKAAENSFKAVNKGAVAAGAGASALAKGGLRNVSLQLSQVAQQGAATGNYLQALAIQLPDLALGFGTIGIAAGAVAGALLPVALNMLQVDQNAQTLDDGLKAVKEIATSLDETLKILGMSATELGDEFGAAAGRVREFALVQGQLRVAEANAALQEQIGLLDELILRYSTEQTSQRYRQQILQRIGEQFGINAQQAEILSNALLDLKNAPDYEGQVAALRNLVDLMSALGVNAADIPPELAKALDDTITLSREMDAAQQLADQVAASAGAADGAIAGAAGSAAALAANLHAAAAAFSRVQAQGSKEYSGRGGDPRQFMEGGSQSDYENSADYTPVSDLIARYAPKRSGGGRSGGGGGGLSAEMREAQSLFQATRTEAEKYATELARIEELHAGGFITDETYARGLDMIAEKYGRAGQAAGAFESITDTLKTAILDFATDGTVAMDRLAESIKRAALEALLFGEGPLGGLFGQGLLGGLFKSVSGGLPSRDGGGYTWDGPRSGGLDGRGGRLALLHPNETVLDHARGQGMGASITYAPVIDARGADQAAVARLAEVVAEDRKNFASNVQRIVSNTGLRGR